MIEVTVPIKIESVSNKREHWSKSHSRAVKQAFAVRLMLKSKIKEVPLPVVVTLTRIAPRKLDFDNLVGGGFKKIRDTVADLLIPGLRPGQADGDPRITWCYAQEKASKTYACKIRIQPRGSVVVEGSI